MASKIFKLTMIMILLVSSVFCLPGCGRKLEDDSQEEVSKDVYEKPVRAYLEGIKSKSLEQVLQVYPEFMHMEKLITQDNIDELYTNFAETEYTLSDAIKVDEGGIKKLESQLKSLYMDAGDINIEKAYIITAKVIKVTKVDNQDPQEETENSETQQANPEQAEANESFSQDFYTYCYNGNWYLY